jgi:hypothetical protein
MSDRSFLELVERLNEKFNSIDINGNVEPLVHSFWSYAEIVGVSRELRAEWEVPPQLVPFYGDWHDLICLDEVSGAVVYLDDDRLECIRWPSSGEFLAALQHREEELTDAIELDHIEVKLDPNLLK